MQGQDGNRPGSWIGRALGPLRAALGGWRTPSHDGHCVAHTVALADRVAYARVAAGAQAGIVDARILVPIARTDTPALQSCVRDNRAAPLDELAFADDSYALFDLTPDMALAPDRRDLVLSCVPRIVAGK